MRITSRPPTWFHVTLLHITWLHIYTSTWLHGEQWIELCIRNMKADETEWNHMKWHKTEWNCVGTKWNSITFNETLNETETWFISHTPTAHWCKWFDTNLLSNFIKAFARWVLGWMIRIKIKKDVNQPHKSHLLLIQQVLDDWTWWFQDIIPVHDDFSTCFKDTVSILRC